MSDQATAAHRRWPFWTGIAAAIVLGLPLLLIAVVLVALNTPPGQRAAERLAARLTGGTVRLAGLHGRLPDAPRLDRLELRDARGVWLSADAVALDWSPLRLIGLDARVRSLTAARVAVARLPVAGAPAKPGSGPFRLPVAVDAARIAIADLSLGAELAGAPAHLAADGQAHLRSLTRGTIDLGLRRTDAAGIYALHAAMTGSAVNARLSAQEPARGLASMAAHLPDLGALGLDGTLSGPWHAATLNLALAAGSLRAGASGTLDLDRRAADLAITANAPAMTPAPGLGWASVALAVRLTGPFARPAASGTLDIAALAAGGASIGRIAARITADTHTAGLTAQAEQVRLPAPNETLLAGGGLTAQARIRLDDPARPITYGFEQALLHGEGSAILQPQLKAQLKVTVPDLHLLAQARGRDVTGSAGLLLVVSRDRRAATHIVLDAAMDVTGGADAPPAARGNATLGASVTLDGADIVLSRLKLDGTTVHAAATGARRGGHVTAEWRVASADLHELAPALRGNAELRGRIAGTQQDFAADADLAGAIGTTTLAPAPVKLSLHGTGLPNHPAGHVQGEATLDRAPLTLDVDATRDPDQTLRVTINRADWKSARIAGALARAPDAALPTGRLEVAITRLDDLRPLLGQPLTGSVAGTVIAEQQGQGLRPWTPLGALPQAGVRGRSPWPCPHATAPPCTWRRATPACPGGPRWRGRCWTPGSPIRPAIRWWPRA